MKGVPARFRRPAARRTKGWLEASWDGSPKGGDGFGSVHGNPTEPERRGDAIRIRSDYGT
jgi:hypothetical protein